ncbi:MAG: hypothetical protein GXP54_11975 [Deltaproteobacteria bacterium]|nr:hypothetical protein [Deltaproteobacteria bacterium]
MGAPSIDEIAEEMYQMVADSMGKKNLKSGDLSKAIQKKYPDVDRKMCKLAIRQLMDNGRCVYAYFGGSYIQLPHKEGAAND